MNKFESWTSSASRKKSLKSMIAKKKTPLNKTPILVVTTVPIGPWGVRTLVDTVMGTESVWAGNPSNAGQPVDRFLCRFGLRSVWELETLLMLKLHCSGRKRLIPYPDSLAQRITRLSAAWHRGLPRGVISIACAISVLRNDKSYKYISMFGESNSARQTLSFSGSV